MGFLRLGLNDDLEFRKQTIINNFELNLNYNLKMEFLKRVFTITKVIIYTKNKSEECQPEERLIRQWFLFRLDLEYENKILFDYLLFCYC